MHPCHRAAGTQHPGCWACQSRLCHCEPRLVGARQSHLSPRPDRTFPQPTSSMPSGASFHFSFIMVTDRNQGNVGVVRNLRILSLYQRLLSLSFSRSLAVIHPNLPGRSTSPDISVWSSEGAINIIILMVPRCQDFLPRFLEKRAS